MRELPKEIDDRSRAILEIMDDLEYRRVESREDLEEVGRLRRRAYYAYGLLRRAEPIIDPVDTHPNARVFALYYRGDLVSTIRLHHVTVEHRYGTSYDIFPDILDPLLDQGMTFIDSVRHAVDPDIIGELPMPFLTTRLVCMACHYFEADYTLACIKKTHYAFYRRAFGATQFADARMWGDFGAPLGLFASSYNTMYDRVQRRFPFFRGLERERKLLFAPSSSMASPPLTIRPTARLALSAGEAATAAA